MMVDIFYPIFTLTITVLARFIRKKLNSSGVSHLHLCQGIALDPLEGLTGPTRPPAAIVFAFAKKRCAHIFSVLSPESALFIIKLIELLDFNFLLID